ncbi:MAG: D-cysteine desulfhydrase family protein [Anaerolineae bacterium]|nr:MAG: D-cysteine desulfhydrase family protein [Anaerolineae bacterium]
MNSIPRISFAHLPTAIEEMPRLTAALGGPKLLIKRDDQTGLAFGGNKTRKLEFLMAEAREQGACLLITGGAMQSNHCRQTAAAAARFGMECILVLTGEHQEQPTGNLLLDFLFDADVVWVQKREERDARLQEIYQQAQQSGCKPYLVPYGGSNATGALGYAFAVQEMLSQGVQPDWVVFGSSSGGTHAGLVLGQRVFGYQGKMLGISIDEPAAKLKADVAALASAAGEKLGTRFEFTPEDILATDDYCQAGYGVFGEGEREAITLFARYEGILLDPVYTGRAAAGLLDLIRQGFFKKDETVLFWHTGGQPALFAEQYQPEIL